MTVADERITLDDIAQFDSRVQLAVLAATSRIYAAGLVASNSSAPDIRNADASACVQNYLELVSPLILGTKNPD